MQPFYCPQCGHFSEFDPLRGSAVCPKCGYTPPTDRRVVADQQPAAGKPSSTMPAGSAGTALSLLDELLSLWEDRLVLLPGLAVKTRREALAFFQLYEQALGEARYPDTDQRFAYARSYKPEKKAVVGFVGAYLMLKRGERATAAKALRDLAQRYPSFPDPWIWLSATTHNRAERIDHLENAVVIEPAHPLAREALAIARGRVMPEAKGPLTTGQLRVVQAKCAMCGGGLEYMPGAIAVTCPYCGHALEFDLENVVDAEGTLIGQALSFSELRRTFQVTTVTYQLVLLPVWVGLARQVHEARLVLVNGQTGRVALSSPLRSGPLD